jgi:hypothetical protein
MKVRFLNPAGLGIESGRGLLRHRDLRRITRQLKAGSNIDAQGVTSTEVGNGLKLFAQRGTQRPPAPFEVEAVSVDSVERTKVFPGLIFSGTSWIEPTIDGVSLFANPTPTLLGQKNYVYLKIGFRPYVPPGNYVNTPRSFSARYDRAPSAVFATSAEVLNSDAAVPANLNAVLQMDTEGFTFGIGRYITITADGFLYYRLATHKDVAPPLTTEGIYPASRQRRGDVVMTLGSFFATSGTTFPSASISRQIYAQSAAAKQLRFLSL